MFKESSDRVVKEISIIVLTFLAILSGAFFVFLRSEYAQNLLIIFQSTEQVKVAQATQVTLDGNSSNISIIQSGASLAVQSSVNINSTVPTGNIDQEPLSSNNTNGTRQEVISNNSIVQNSSKSNDTQVDPETSTTSIQAYAQKKLDTSYLVVKRPYDENKVFETLTPFVSKVKVDRYILQKDGKVQGYLYELLKVDGSISSTYSFMKDLAEKVLKNEKNIITDAPFGKRSFYYNNIDKAEVIRIVIESRSGGVYALEIPSVLSSDFKEFLRQL